MVKPVEEHGKLFQPGHNPVIEMHDMQLYRVLEEWKGLVERGLGC